MDDALVSASLAYRKNEPAILRGEVPEKYTRLIPFIPGQKIIEIGSAEGVLALLLAKSGKDVVAVERRSERVESAHRLGREWNAKAPIAGTVEFVEGDIIQNLELFEGKDTLLAVRMIYYLGTDLDRVFDAADVESVVLCGNANRARWWKEGLPNRNDRADNYYASAEGMKDVLTRHGFSIACEVLEGDPIVVGRR
jgi:SAM-dependent methyltransferase